MGVGPSPIGLCFKVWRKRGTRQRDVDHHEWALFCSIFWGPWMPTNPSKGSLFFYCHWCEIEDKGTDFWVSLRFSSFLSIFDVGRSVFVGHGYLLESHYCWAFRVLDFCKASKLCERRTTFSGLGWTLPYPDEWNLLMFSQTMGSSDRKLPLSEWTRIVTVVGKKAVLLECRGSGVSNLVASFRKRGHSTTHHQYFSVRSFLPSCLSLSLSLSSLSSWSSWGAWLTWSLSRLPGPLFRLVLWCATFLFLQS